MRLFVAADLPDAVRAALPCAGAREKLHVTLVFLGDREEPPGLALTPPRAELRVVGPARLGRVFAAGVEDPTGAWTEYQAALAAELGVVAARPWRPHITLSRKRRPDPVEPVTFVPPSVTLYESRGGRYAVLARLSAQS